MGSARMARATMYSNTECTDPDVFVCVCVRVMGDLQKCTQV